jgi:hypothetical protein
MSETPLVPSLSEAMAARDAEVGGAEAAEKLRLRGGIVKGFNDEEDAPQFRMFLSPQNPTGKYLVRAGSIRKASNQNAPLGMEALMGRDGDVWVKFTSGVVAVDLDDPDADTILAWLEAHSGDPDAHRDYHRNTEGVVSDPRQCTAPIGLCHESGPGVDAWAELKAGQIPTSRRAANISPDLDVDAFLRGDHLQGKSLRTGEGARMSQAAENEGNARSGRGRGQRNNI